MILQRPSWRPPGRGVRSPDTSDGRHTMPWQLLPTISRLLADTPTCWLWQGAFHFALDAEGEWTLGVSRDSACRLRFDTCHLGRPRATKWSQEDDGDRIAAIVLEARDEVLAEVQ